MTIIREELAVGGKLIYLPGHVEVTVHALSPNCDVLVQDPDGSVHKVPPEDYDLYAEPTS